MTRTDAELLKASASLRRRADIVVDIAETAIDRSEELILQSHVLAIRFRFYRVRWPKLPKWLSGASDDGRSILPQRRPGGM